MLSSLPYTVLDLEITSYLDFPSVLALKLCSKALYEEINSERFYNTRIERDLKGNKEVCKQIDTERDRLCKLNPLQFRCVVEKLCFWCNCKYEGPANLELYLHGHKKCISKILISASVPDCNGEIPMKYLPDSFPALVFPKQYRFDVEGNIIPNESSCFIIGRKVNKVQVQNTLEGFLEQVDLPRLKSSPYSPKRFRREREGPPPPPSKPALKQRYYPQNGSILLFSCL